MNFATPIEPEPPVQSIRSMSASNSPPKRPRLSLQIKAPTAPQVLGKSITALKTDFADPNSPTAFNTLSNAYATAIESCSPGASKPAQGPAPTISTTTTSSSSSSRPKFPRLQTSSSDPGSEEGFSFSQPSSRTQTPGPFTNLFPDSPSTSISPTSKGSSSTNSAFLFTFTPPQSAHPQEASDPKVFTFAASHLSTSMSPISPNGSALRRRNTIAGFHSAPYTHPRSLRSILRNSPLPPRSSVTPASPRRMSIRYNPNKRVGYNTPLTQTITTKEYTHSHIDLLSEDASPFTPTDAEKEDLLERALVYRGDETRDGGQTPGSYEEMRRRMASLGGGDEASSSPPPAPSSNPSNPSSSTSKKESLRKRKRKEKKRQWMWTIGDNEDEEKEKAEMMMMDTPVLPPSSLSTAATAGKRASSLPPQPAATSTMLLEFPPNDSRESSISCSDQGSEDIDMEGGRDTFVGSPHSV